MTLVGAGNGSFKNGNKKKLISVGFFKELDNGEADGPSIVSSKRDKAFENENKIIDYLKAGLLFEGCLGIMNDYFDTDKIIGAGNVLTDGTYAWLDVLPYYVSNYHVELPDDFIQHMKRNNWIVLSEDKIDLDNIEL